jgi:hypothetical protein
MKAPVSLESSATTFEINCIDGKYSRLQRQLEAYFSNAHLYWIHLTHEKAWRNVLDSIDVTRHMVQPR